MPNSSRLEINSPATERPSVWNNSIAIIALKSRQRLSWVASLRVCISLERSRDFLMGAVLGADYSSAVEKLAICQALAINHIKHQ